MKGQRQGSATARRGMAAVGVFDDHHLADQAVRQLRDAGFCENNIDIALRRGAEPVDDVAVRAPLITSSSPRIDAGLDAPPADGVPGIAHSSFEPGSMIHAFGTISSSATAARATISSLMLSLLGAGFPEHEARYYRNEWEAGRTIITVASGVRSREAKAILRRHGSYDMISGICTRAIS